MGPRKHINFLVVIGSCIVGEECRGLHSPLINKGSGTWDTGLLLRGVGENRGRRTLQWQSERTTSYLSFISVLT